MFTTQKAQLLASALLICAIAAPAQAPPPAPAGSPALPGRPPASSAGIYPLSAVHAGQHGVAYTVFEGTVPEAFGVDILGILHNAEGPGEDLILSRLTGAKAEYTGVVAGMSGSPVYIDGKLVGALAFRIGEFSKEPIAGITPIAQMLKVRDLDNSLGGGLNGGAGGKATPETTANATPTDPASVGSNQVRPIDTPLVFSGFSPAAVDLWKQHAPALGMEPTAGLGGASSSAEGTAIPPLEPGSAVSALLVSGDMEIAATCTVTYLDAGHLLACGHPLTQFGAVSLPMTKAEIVATLASPAGSFKIVNTGETVGAFTQDRQTAIGGLLGSAARMIPVEIKLHTAQPDAASAATRTLRLKVLDQAQVTPTAILVSLFQALQQTPGYAEEDSYRVHATVRMVGYPPVEISTLASPGGLGTSALSAALTVGLRFNALYSSTERQTSFSDISIDVEKLHGRQAATLNRAVLERGLNQSSLHAGDEVTVAVTLAPYRGPLQSLRVPVRLPASLPDGDVRLLVSDGPTLDRLLAAGRVSAATPLAATISQLNSMHPDDQLYVTLLKPEAELSVDGQTLNSVPLSVANLLVPSHDRERGSLHGESAEPLASIPVHASFTGEQILTLRVE